VQGNPIRHEEIDGYGWRDFGRGFVKGLAFGLAAGAVVATLPISGTALLVIGAVGVVATVASAAKVHADFASKRISAEEADERYGEIGGGLVGGVFGGGAGRGFKGALTALAENARPSMALMPAGPGGFAPPPPIPVSVGGVSVGTPAAIPSLAGGAGAGGLVTAMAVANQPTGGGGTPTNEKEQKAGYEPGDRHPNSGNEVLGKLNRPDRTTATPAPGNPKLDEQISAAKPSTKLEPPPTVTLDNPGTHDPTSPNYVPKKSVMPPRDQQAQLFNDSVAVTHNGQTIPARGAVDQAGNVHQFHATGPNNYHWAGSSAGKTASGKEVGLDRQTTAYFRRLWRTYSGGD